MITHGYHATANKFQDHQFKVASFKGILTTTLKSSTSLAILTKQTQKALYNISRYHAVVEYFKYKHCLCYYCQSKTVERLLFAWIDINNHMD